MARFAPKLCPAKGFAFSVAALLALAAAALAATGSEPESEPAVPAPEVVHIRVDSIIHRGSAEFILESLTAADERGADAFVLELSTPGGAYDATREIFTGLLNAESPTVVWVAPSGAQAASAGFFILLAADVAAMAPGTNTGAAHPVAGDGSDIEGHLGEKVEQDSLATIRSLAERNNRNLEMAEAAVLKSRSFTADEALENGLIDLVAPDLDALLAAIDGREVRRGQSEETAPLRTAGADVRRLEMSPFQRFLSVIAHPNVAAILMSLGFLGLYFEFSNPGAILPGVVGAICLILGFLALSVLPVNVAGIALLLLAGILFIAEIKITSYGLLSVGAIISLVLGYSLLFKSADPVLRVSWQVILSVAVTAGLAVLFLMTMVVRAHRSQVKTGVEGLVHKVGVARTALEPRGKVFVWGEIWNAVAESPVAAGQRVEVTAVNGMELRVRPHPAGGGEQQLKQPVVEEGEAV